MRRFENEESALEYLNTLPWGNAAGTCKDSETALRFAQAGMKNIMFGSITFQPREGNSGDNFYRNPDTGDSINSLGLPNKGIDAYLPELVTLMPSVQALGSELWVSVSAGSAFNAEEYFSMARRLTERRACSVVEGNFSCPNVVVGGKPKPNVCYDIAAFRDGVAALSLGARSQSSPQPRTSVKIAPITEPAILSGLVEQCIDAGVDYIVAANTLGNCYMEKAPGVPAITMVRGGLAGRALRPVIKGMVQMIAPMLRGTNTKLIAVGGIEHGFDAYEYFTLGAQGFQFNTALSWRNYDPRMIHDILFGSDISPQASHGLLNLLVERGIPG